MVVSLAPQFWLSADMPQYVNKHLSQIPNENEI
jgi:hypothetical protein